MNDQIFEDSNDGALDMAIKKLENYTEYKQLTIYAVDLADNQSESVNQKNPLYKSSSGSRSNGGGGGGSAPPIIPSTSAAPTATASPTPTAMPTALAPTPVPTPELTVAPNPFTLDCTGMMLNYAGSKDSKEFYVVTTPNENTFYLVIDRDRGTENVYFLDAVSERDLMTLTGPSGYVEPTPEPTVAPVATPEPTPIPEPPPEPPKQGNGSMVLILVIVALGAGGTGYYFKILKPKQQPEMEEYEDYDDDEEMTRDDGSYDDDDMDDLE